MIFSALYPFLPILFFATHVIYDELDIFEYVTTLVFIENASEQVYKCIVFFVVYVNRH